MKQKAFFFIFVILMLGFSAMAAAPIDAVKESSEQQADEIKESPVEASLLGFQAWKKKQVFQARATLDAFKAPKLEDNNEPEMKPEAQAERLRQLEYNLEIALGLTIHDYFSLYLREKSKEDLAEVVKQLSPEELSELLLAYRKKLQGPALNQEPVEPKPTDKL